MINLDRLSELFPEGGQLSADDLVAAGAVRDGYPVKVLGSGEVSVAFQITADKFSGAAKSKIEAAGGKAVVLGEPTE